MIVRSGNLDDYNSVIKIMDLCKLDLHERGLNVWDSNYPTYEMIHKDLESGYSIVCEDNGEVLSFMMVIPNKVDTHEEAFINHENFCLVKRVMVHTDHRRKGLAKRMFLYLETLGYKSIRLTARDKNTFAINLYKKLGYKKNGNYKYDWAVMGVYEKIL